MRLKLVSDGTNTGTKLIDEDTGEMVHGISKITWEANAKDVVTKTTVEFFNIPVDIQSKAEVHLQEWVSVEPTINSQNKLESSLDFAETRSFEKDIKIVSEANKNTGIVTASKTLVKDAPTDIAVGAVQSVRWEATPEGSKAVLTKVRMGKDWV